MVKEYIESLPLNEQIEISNYIDRNEIDIQDDEDYEVVLECMKEEKEANEMHLKRLIVNRTEYEDLKDIKKLKAKLFLTSLLTLYMGGTIDRNQLQW